MGDIGGVLKERGIEVFVITNGNAFTPERLHRLASFSQELVLSYLAEHVLGLPRSF